MIVGGSCMPVHWLDVSLFIVALSSVLQPALAGPLLQQSEAVTPSSAQPCNRENNFDSRVRRGMTSLEEYAWPNATVPYEISEQFSEEESEVLLSAMEWWTVDTCLHFVQHTKESQYLHFVQSSSCRSAVGKQPQSGPQTVDINQACLDNVGSIAHQIGHALGFWHEHQRPDRDEFVEVLYDNIPPPYHHLFYKLPEDEINSLGIGYDYGSIMHISLFAYSIDSNTPSLRLLKDYGGEVGQRRNTSESDREQVRLFYGCQGASPQLTQSPVPTTTTMASSSFQSLASSSVPALPQSHQAPPPSLSLSRSQSISHSLQSVPSISPSLCPLQPSPHFTVQLKNTMGDAVSLSPISSVSWPATTMNPSALPTPSLVLQPNVEIPFVIAAGVEFGMRFATEPAFNNFWMACKGERSKTCKLSQCPSKHGLHQQQCQGSTYTLDKINGSSNASIIVDRDWVILRPSSDASSIVHCGGKSKANSVCKYSNNGCGMLGEFETEPCSYHIMEVHLHENNSSGDSSHRRVTLYFLDKEKTSWLGCNLHDKMKCKRFSCEDPQSCTPDSFELVEIS